jgi:serine/threonine-protein kinase RsbW
MKKPEVCRMTMASDPKNIVKVERFLEKVGSKVALDEIQMNKLMVSLTEAVNNAIVHGNKSNPKKKVTVTCEAVPGWLLLVVNDQGRGFDPKLVANPLKNENLLRESGRGIFLMRTLMDKVEFETIRGGYEVRLWLELRK